MDELRIGELLARVRDGDAAAWAALTDRYTNLLWSIARGLRMNEPDAADAVQTTWLRLVENLDQIRDPDKLGSWLATTVRRECYDISRRASRVQPGAPGPEGWDQIEADDDPLDDALLRDERDAMLWRAFHGLRPNCQSLLRVLIAEPSPSYAEVSAALDIPVGSIGPTRQRCLKCLRDLLRAEENQSLTPDGHSGSTTTRAHGGDRR
jgi:RNA polymerase sigma factor (sigma-70 family)